MRRNRRGVCCRPAGALLYASCNGGRKKSAEDLKVVAYDGMDITRLCYPQVTSIDQNIRFLADTCASTVIKLIDGSERVPHKQIMSVEVHQGKTTNPVVLDGNF